MKPDTTLRALVFATSLASVLDALPSCMSACSVVSTTPCTTDSLPALISCLNDQCSSNNTLSTYAVALSPKMEYSCQQSYVPGDDTPTAVLKMTGQGQCMTSPYDFESFVTSAGNSPWASGVCRILIYPEADCIGPPKDLALMQHSEGCTFESGRSARLDCSQSSDLSVARRYIEQMCLRTGAITMDGLNSNTNNDTTVSQTDSNPDNASAPSNSLSQSISPLVLSSLLPLDSTATLFASSASLPSNMPISRPNSSFVSNETSRLISSSPIETATSYLGGAVQESKDATFAAMFALTAAFILL